MNRIRFILAVESYLVRRGLAVVLKAYPDISIKELDTIEQLDRYMKQHGSDFLIICDSLFNKATSIFLENPALIEKTILLNKSGKKESAENVKESISINDKPGLIQLKIENLLAPFNKDKDPQLPDLSEREKTIVKFAATGYTNKEIAEKLFLSSHTVITHRKNISRKLGIKSVSGLTVYAIVNNIINIEEIAGIKKAEK